MIADPTYQEVLRTKLMETLGTTDAEWADDVILAISPMMTCSVVGHKDHPTAFLRRFLSRPWRCSRCKAWFVTEQVYDYSIGTAYAWKCIGLDDDTPWKEMS